MWIILIVVLLLLLLLFCHHQLNDIKITKYEVKQNKSQKIKKNYTIVQISDLHSKIFDHKNVKLLKIIQNINPDLIVATGDMINSTDKDGDVFFQLAKTLKHDYPLIYIEGNHELTAKFDTLNLENDWYEQFLERLSSIGVTLLRNEFLKIGDITIYGITVPLTHYRAVPPQIQSNAANFYLNPFNKLFSNCTEDKFSIVLCHSPFFISELKSYPIDIVISGHIHGGIVRLPLIGGILSPERKFFPRFSAGIYQIYNKILIVNRGLGTSSLKLRLFNKPEITVIKLIYDM